MIETNFIKFIPATDNLFMVSTDGSVFSMVKSSKSKKPMLPKLLSPSRNSVTGYYQVRIKTVSSGWKTVYVHRLVAQAFINNPNPDIFTQVSHIDEDPSNNSVSNLEWVTPKYNCNYGYHNEKLRQSHIGNKNCGRKSPVASVDTYSGEIINVFESIRDAARNTDPDKWNSTCVMINLCLQGKLRTAKGYSWIRLARQ